MVGVRWSVWQQYYIAVNPLPQTTITLAGCNVCAGDCSDGSVIELSHLMVQTHYTLSSLITPYYRYNRYHICDSLSKIERAAANVGLIPPIFCPHDSVNCFSVAQFKSLAHYHCRLFTILLWPWPVSKRSTVQGIENSVRRERERVRRYFSLNYSGGFLHPLNTNSWQIGHWAAPPPH